jgi:hypothetical protein
MNDFGKWFSPRVFSSALGVLILVMFPAVILGTKTFYFRDYCEFGYPLAFYGRQSFWQAQVPLWNPLNNCGIPFLAQWNTLVCYPLSTIYLLFPLPWSLSFFCLFHLWLGGVGMYFLTLRLTGNYLSASVAGILFAFNGLTLNFLMWPNHIAAFGWMPWVVNSGDRAWLRGGRTTLSAASLGAMQMLSGTPEIILFTWIIILVLCSSRRWTGLTSFIASQKRFVLVVLLISGICAVQLLPFLDLLRHSNRDPSYASSTYSSMPAWGWANLLVPLFHCYDSSTGVFFQDGQIWTSSYYVGIEAIALACLVWFTRPAWRLRLLGCGAVFALVLAMGDDGFLYPVLRRVLPLTGMMNFPMKFVIPVIFVVPVLAAFAIRELPQRETNSDDLTWRRLTGITLLLAALVGIIVGISRFYPKEEGEWAAVWPNAVVRLIVLFASLFLLRAIKRRIWKPRMRGLLAAALLFVFWIDFYTHMPEQNPLVSPAVYQTDLRAAREFDPIPRVGESRVMLSLAGNQKFSRTQLGDSVAGLLGRRVGLSHNCNLLEGIPKIDGFYALYLREQYEVRIRIYLTTDSILDRVADYMGASQITAEGAFLEWKPRATFLPLITAGQKPIFADDAATLLALLDPRFNPRNMIYLPLDAGELAAADGNSAVVNHPEFSNHQIQFWVESPSPTIVSIAQTYYHCWSACVDDRPVPLARANHAFQAVLAPAGHHRVTLVYRDLHFLAGAIISILSLAVSGIARYVICSRKLF